MQKRLIIILLFTIFIFSSATFFSTIQYVDPYANIVLAISALTVSFVMSFVSLVTICLYFFKKIYYRGEVYTYHIFTSLRQSILGALLVIFYVVLQSMGVPIIFPIVLATGVVIFLELFFQNIEK